MLGTNGAERPVTPGNEVGSHQPCLIAAIEISGGDLSQDHQMLFSMYVSSLLLGSVKAERLRELKSNSGVPDQQSVGSNPQPPLVCSGGLIRSLSV